MKTLFQYNNDLATHDWFYAFSDDHRVWTSGRLKGDMLEQDSKLSPLHGELYKIWCSYVKELNLSPSDKLPEIRAKHETAIHNFLTSHAQSPLGCPFQGI